MTWIASTLWDLITRTRTPADAPPPVQRSIKARPRPMQARYDELVREMKATYGLRVRKWRTSTSGCAWKVLYRDGTEARLIESPYPRGPMSCAVFLHEVGHHAIGLGRYRPRCLEEYHAWMWSLDAMRQHGFNVTDRVTQRVEQALQYAVWKGLRAGLRSVPAELTPYIPPAAHMKMSIKDPLGITTE